MMTGLRLLAVGVGFALLSVSATAQRGDANNAVPSLKGVAVPQPAGLGRYVVDTQALVVLGKALFWDVQVGSDGRTAWASVISMPVRTIASRTRSPDHRRTRAVRAGAVR